MKLFLLVFALLFQFNARAAYLEIGGLDKKKNSTGLVFRNVITGARSFNLTETGNSFPVLEVCAWGEHYQERACCFIKRRLDSFALLALLTGPNSSQFAVRCYAHDLSNMAAVTTDNYWLEYKANGKLDLGDEVIRHSK